MGFRLMLRLKIVNGHYVEIPAAQLRSQAHVLTITANRLRQVARFHGDIHGVLIFINNDGSHIGRCHRVNHELRWVIVPQYDINTLAAQFGRYRLNACATHTYAGTNRVDTLIVGLDGDFRT